MHWCCCKVNIQKVCLFHHKNCQKIMNMHKISKFLLLFPEGVVVVDSVLGVGVVKKDIPKHLNLG